MKKIFTGFIAVLLCVAACAQSKTCIAGCASTTVLLFDFEVSVSRESTNPELVKKLYCIAPWLRRQLTGKECCLEFVDVNAVSRPEDIFPDGSSEPVINVQDPMPYHLGEYLLTGTITGQGTVFLVTANIETTVSRKKIKTVHVPVSFSEGDAYTSVAQKLERALGSMQDVIREYETKERETNMKVAFGQPIVKTTAEKELLVVKPQKTKLVMGEETEVEITLTDCDGYPLQNRSISFTGEMYDSVWQKGTYGGTVTPSKVTTDAAGKAKVKFKAGREYAFAAILAHYSFEQPCGRKDVITGSAAIDMQLKTYKVLVRYSKQLKENTDYSNTTSEYTEKSEGTHHYLAQYKAEFYYAPRQPLEQLAIASNDDTSVCKIFMAAEKGHSSDISFLHYRRRATDGTLIADDQQAVNLQGKMVEEEKAAAFLDTTGIHLFGLILNLNVTGTFNGTNTEPAIFNVANISASSMNKEVVFETHPMNYPGFPYQKNCVFIYSLNTQKSEKGVLAKYGEFLQIMVLVEK